MTSDLRHPSFVHALMDNADRGHDSARVSIARSAAQHTALRHDELVHEALATAAVLTQAGVRPGDRVLISLRTSPEFVTAFLGALVLGALPVALAPPRMGAGNRIGEHGSREHGFREHYRDVVSYLRPRALICLPRILAGLEGHLDDVLLLDGARLRETAGTCGDTLTPVLPHPDDIAFLQLTSGSTAAPKAVMVSHGNLASNCRQLGRASGWGMGDVQVAWLPLHHDMGLVGTLMAPIYHGIDALLLAPETFLRAPSEWLRAISRVHGTLSAAPNFALDYTVARVGDDELDGVDLTSLRFVFCGAEPNDPTTMHRFVSRFAPWGLQPDVLVPSYGLAEATLGVAVGRPESPVRYDTVTTEMLSGTALPRIMTTNPPPDVPTRQIVVCGPPLPGTEIRIVDDTGTTLPDSSVGRIQFRGPSRTMGYYQRPQETAAVLDRDGWWDTGDLGYLRDGELRVAGRATEVIIIRGVNHFPTDFEKAAESVPGVRPGRVAAVGIYDRTAGTDMLHIIAETDLGSDQHHELRSAIVGEVTRRCDIAPAAVHLMPRGTIQKTTSGKIKRHVARRQVAECATTGPEVH
ncbi:MAG: putative adenylation protein [Mycobacterium sp.]|nr:putative adenylation protein [Mycobacterium sp.]